MKKVTEKTCKAFIEGKKLGVGNTVSTGTELLLHGNKIAWKENNKVYLSDCGWQTVTTKERLNGLLRLLNTDSFLSQNRYQWFLRTYLQDNESVCEKWEGKGVIENGKLCPIYQRKEGQVYISHNEEDNTCLRVQLN